MFLPFCNFRIVFNFCCKTFLGTNKDCCLLLVGLPYFKKKIGKYRNTVSKINDTPIPHYIKFRSLYNRTRLLTRKLHPSSVSFYLDLNTVNPNVPINTARLFALFNPMIFLFGVSYSLFGVSSLHMNVRSFFAKFIPQIAFRNMIVPLSRCQTRHLVRARAPLHLLHMVFPLF